MSCHVKLYGFCADRILYNHPLILAEQVADVPNDDTFQIFRGKLAGFAAEWAGLRMVRGRHMNIMDRAKLRQAIEK